MNKKGLIVLIKQSPLALQGMELLGWPDSNEDKIPFIQHTWFNPLQHVHTKPINQDYKRVVSHDHVKKSGGFCLFSAY